MMAGRCFSGGGCDGGGMRNSGGGSEGGGWHSGCDGHGGWMAVLTQGNRALFGPRVCSSV